MPALARLMTMIVQSTQTLKPRCSAKIENSRFLRATALPPPSQNRSSSGSQLSIHRPPRATGEPIEESTSDEGEASAGAVADETVGRPRGAVAPLPSVLIW